MVVMRRTPNGTYRLAELDGAVSKLRYAAFHLVPYHAYSRTLIPVTHIIERNELIKIHLDEDVEGAADDPRDSAGSDVSDA
jgi:hypothetical protein